MKRSMTEAAYLGAPLDILPSVELGDGEVCLELPDDVETLERVIVTMPWGAVSNYGHFVLDCLPAVASTVEISGPNGYRFAFPPLRSWQRRHLELLGVDSPLELDRTIYRVADLLFTSCMDNFLHQPNVNYRTLRDRQLTAKLPTSRSWEKVYISRRDASKRTFLSEDRLEAQLTQLGFAVLTPDTLTVDEQIDAFRGADVLVGTAGAGLANALYCHPGATVVEIAPRRMVSRGNFSGRWLYKLCAIAGCNWRPYYCFDVVPDESAPGESEPRREVGYAFDLDVDDLLEYVHVALASQPATFG